MIQYETTELKKHLEEQGFLSLQQFFEEEVFLHVQKELATAEFIESNKLMYHNYRVAHQPGDEAIEALRNFVERLIGELPALKIYQFSNGHYKLRETRSRYIVVFDASAQWQEGNGADICVTTDEHTLVVPPTPNTLTICKVQDDEFFVTYGNHRMQGTRTVMLNSFGDD